MKTSISLFASLIACLVCTGCSQENDDALESPQHEECYSLDAIDVEFNVDKPSFEDETGTRATNAGVWENGDVVYLRLDNGGNKTNVAITYNGATQKWELSNTSSVQTLVNAGKATCSAAYSTGIDPVTEDDGIRYSYMTALYQTDSGEYSYSADTKKLKITATLYCSGWRLRFKGTTGTKIALYNLNMNVRYRQCFDTTFDSETGRAVTMTVGANGYTDYIVIGTIKEDCHLILITNLSTGDTFYRSFGVSVVGADYLHKSYNYTIPTTSNLKGWKRSNAASGTVNGHDYVDLSLPSGNMWATVNIGASSATQSGDYYQWAETATDTNYNWANYKYCNGSETTLTKYCNKANYGTVDNRMLIETPDDVASMKWGEDWKIPSEPQADEMVLNCFWYWITLKNQPGMIVIGKNGKSIFFPAAGYKERTNTPSKGELGVYLTASLYQDKPSRFMYLGLNQEQMFTSRMARSSGVSARAIYNPDSHKYVDLGLPSGTLWATCNVGASSPEESGSYFAWGETTPKESYTNATYTYSGSSDLSGDSDAAQVAWGDQWRMPTLAECQELYNNCEVISTTENGVSGFKYVSTNGKSIFIPKSGYYSGSTLQSGCNYWTSTYRNSSTAYFLEGTGYRAAYRYEGLTIRPVRSAGQ